jgi:SAM-dependent methyltransferase
MNQDKIWEYFQYDEEAGAANFDAEARYRFLAARIPTGQLALNIGVGRGGLEAQLMAKGVEIHSLDPGEKSIERLRLTRGMGEKAQVGFSQTMPFANATFDVVVMSEVLEHLTDEVIEQTVLEVRRVLRSGGRFIGTVPADENLVENRVICPDCGKVFHRWGHVQTFTRERLAGIVRRGFAEATVTREYFGDWESLNWKGRLSWAAKKGAVALGVKGSGESFFFSAEKR